MEVIWILLLVKNKKNDLTKKSNQCKKTIDLKYQEILI